MYTEHASIVTPPDATVVWRYMDLEKFLATLCSRSLFMCRLDKFRDPWEGVHPESAIKVMDEKQMSTKEWLHGSIKRKTGCFVNCWHAAEHESAALWDLYTNHAGIAIKSTVGQVKSAVSQDLTFLIGQVTYCDYKTCLLYTSPSPRDATLSRMPSSA